MEIERTVSFPSYGTSGSAFSLPSTSVQGKLEKQHTLGVSGRNFTTTSLPFNQEAVARCVATWTQDSNGKIEAKLFETSQVISASDVSAKQLLRLQLECLAGSTASEVKLDAVPSDTIFALMFGSASNGGAYSHGEKGAYGRLVTWQSLAALTGVGASGTIEDVDRAVQKSSWYSFSSTARWFYNIAWDFGIVCLRPEKRRLAIFAATDQD
jgi:hypothetical protein